MADISSQPSLAVKLMRDLGMEPDRWQRQVLEGNQPRLLLNCCRQAGKSTVVALLGLLGNQRSKWPLACASGTMQARRLL